MSLVLIYARALNISFRQSFYILRFLIYLFLLRWFYITLNYTTNLKTAITNHSNRGYIKAQIYLIILVNSLNFCKCLLRYPLQYLFKFIFLSLHLRGHLKRYLGILQLLIIRQNCYLRYQVNAQLSTIQ